MKHTVKTAETSSGTKLKAGINKPYTHMSASDFLPATVQSTHLSFFCLAIILFQQQLNLRVTGWRFVRETLQPAVLSYAH